MPIKIAYEKCCWKDNAISLIGWFIFIAYSLKLTTYSLFTPPNTLTPVKSWAYSANLLKLQP